MYRLLCSFDLAGLTKHGYVDHVLGSYLGNQSAIQNHNQVEFYNLTKKTREATSIKFNDKYHFPMALFKMKLL